MQVKIVEDRRDTAPGIHQNIKSLTVAVGKLLSVDNIKRTGSVGIHGKPTPVTAVFAGVQVMHGSVETTLGYSVGDEVLVAYPEAETLATHNTAICGVIICPLAVTSYGYADAEESNNDSTTAEATLYDKAQLTGTAASDSPNLPPANDQGRYIGPVYNVTGEHTNLHVGHSAIALTAGSVGIHINEFGVLKEAGLFRETVTVSGQIRDFIIDGTVMYQERGSTGGDKPLSVVSKFGALADGRSEGLISDNTVVYRHKCDRNGLTKIDTAAGYVIDVGGPANVLEFRSDIPPVVEADEELLSARDAAVDGGGFIEDCMPKGTNNVYVYKAKESAMEFNEPVVDPSNNATRQGRARFGTLPDGSIILADAWGSEIRMFGGDIFITPARRLVMLSPDDHLIAAGGAVTINGEKLVNMGSGNGPVELAAKCVNISGTESLYLTGDRQQQSIVLTKNLLQIAANDSLKISVVGSVEVGSTDQLAINSERLNIIGTEGLNVGSTGSSFKLYGGGVELGGKITICGDLLVQDRQAAKFTVLGNASIPGRGAGSIKCTGECVVDDRLSVNSSLSVNDCIFANRIGVAQYNKELVGVFSCKRPSKSTIDYVPTISVPGYAQGIGLETIDLSAFKSINKSVYALAPEHSAVGQGIAAAVTVDSGNVERYIYPGKEFWCESGLRLISKDCYYNIDGSRVLTAKGLSTKVKKE